MYAYNNPSTQETEVGGGSRGEGHPWLCTEV